MADEPAPVAVLIAKLDPAVPSEVRRAALAHLAAQGEAAHPHLPAVVAALADPETSHAAAAVLVGLAPLSADLLPGVMAAAADGVLAAVSALRSFGSAGREAVPFLERRLAEGDPPTTIAAAWALLHLDPDHAAANDLLVGELRRGTFQVVDFLARLPALGEATWAELERAAHERTIGGFGHLGDVGTCPDRRLAIVRRVYGDVPLAEALSGDDAVTRYALGAVARIAADAPDLVGADVIDLLYRRADAIVASGRAYELDELAELIDALAARAPDERLDALIVAALGHARALYGAYIDASRTFAWRVAGTLLRRPSAGGAPVGEALAAWVPEPGAGAAVADVLARRGWGPEEVPERARRYWLPRPALPPLDPPAPPARPFDLATDEEVAELEPWVAKAYASCRIDRGVDPAEGVVRLDQLIARLRARFLTPQGQPDDLERWLGWLLGDLVVRGHGWRWAFLRPSPEERLLAAIFGDASTVDTRAAVVVAPERRHAVAPTDAVRRQLISSTTAELLYNMLADERSLPKGTRRRPAWMS